MLLSVPRSLSWWYPFGGGVAVSSTAPSTDRNLVSARRIEGVEAACLCVDEEGGDVGNVCLRDVIVDVGDVGEWEGDLASLQSD